MSQQTLINGETYGQHRTKLNANFTELYAGAGAPVSSVAGRTGAVTLAQADVASNAPVALTGATNLTAATHGNRQITFAGASATLAVLNDASGGWASDEEFIVQTLAGSSGVPTVTTPDGKSITGSATQPIGAKRKGANSWDVYLLPQAAGGGSGITVVRDLTATASPTGTTAESAALKTLTLGALATGQRVKIRGRLSGNTDNSTCAVRLKLAGTTVLTLTILGFSSGGFFEATVDAINTTSQGCSAMCITATNAAVYSISASTVDTSSSVDLTLTMQHGATTRTMSIMYLFAEIYPA